MLHENEKKVLEALKDIGIDDDISKITENEFYLLEMNNNWFLEVKKFLLNWFGLQKSIWRFLNIMKSTWDLKST